MKLGYALYYPWFWKYGSGQDPVFLSFLAMTETAHTFNPLTGTKDTKLGECGLLSLKRATARRYDVNCCSPILNIWAKSQARLDRRKEIDKKYGRTKFFKKMDFADRYLFYGMFEQSYCFRYYSNAIAEASRAKKWPFTCPYMVALNWIKVQGESLKDPKYDSCWGRTSAEVAVFRFARVKAVRDLIIRVYGGGKKGRRRWAKCVRPEISRPNVGSNSKYPGDKLHGKCCPEWQPSSKGKACWGKWEKPTTYRRKKRKGKLIDLWKRWCDEGEDCNYSVVFERWKRKKQAEGLLPSDREYKDIKAEMKEKGCWILQ